MSDLVANLVVGAAILLAGVALLMAIVAFVSFRRLRAGRLAWIGMAFLVEAGAGVYLSMQSIQQRLALAESGPGVLGTVIGLNLAVVLCLYLAVAHR